MEIHLGISLQSTSTKHTPTHTLSAGRGARIHTVSRMRLQPAAQQRTGARQRLPSGRRSQEPCRAVSGCSASQRRSGAPRAYPAARAHQAGAARTTPLCSRTSRVRRRAFRTAQCTGRICSVARRLPLAPGLTTSTGERPPASCASVVPVPPASTSARLRRTSGSSAAAIAEQASEQHTAHAISDPCRGRVAYW